MLSQGTKFHPLGTGNANKYVLCLKLDFIPLWLVKISITPNMRKNNPRLVDKLVKYQLQAKDILADAFIRVKVVRKFLHPSIGEGSQETYCIDIKKLPIVLVKISITLNMKKNDLGRCGFESRG